jgi:hypothetical protein
MIQPATSGVAVPDRHATATRGWLIAYYVTGGVTIVAYIVTIVFQLVMLTTGKPVVAALGSMLVALVFVVLSLVCSLVWFSRQSATRRELADALTRAGHHGVDVKRLLRGKPVASPLGVLLWLRRERDDQGNRWLLVDATPVPSGPLQTPTF